MAYSISCTTTPNPVRKKCITQITPCPQALITNTSTPDKFLYRYLPGKGVYRVPPQCEVAAGEAGAEITVLQFNNAKGDSFDWSGVTFTRDTTLPGFSYVASITSTPAANIPDAGDLIDVTIGSLVTTIDDYAFEGTAITSVIIPASVTFIGTASFYDCGGLASVTFAAGSILDVIGDDAFRDTALQSIVIPASVTSIDGFRGCDQLTSVTFAAGSILDSISQRAFQNSGLTSIVIPASVTIIDNDAFLDCTSLTSVTFAPGSTLNGIGNGAFRQTALQSIVIPASVTLIDDDVFYDCGGLASVTFAPGSTLNSIGFNAFEQCFVLQSIVIPASVQTIGATAFVVSGLTTVYIGVGQFPSITVPSTGDFFGATGVDIRARV